MTSLVKMAVDVKLCQYVNIVWQPVITACKDCLVYMDDGAAEFLHWSGRVLDLVKTAKNVQSLDSPVNGQKGEKEAAFILSSLLHRKISKKVQNIIEGSYFQHCTFFCTISNHDQALASKQDGNMENEKNVFEDFKQAAKFWMNNKFAIVEISHVPLVNANVIPGLFFTPSFSSLFPILPSDLKHIKEWAKSQRTQLNVNSLSEVELHHMPQAFQVKLKLLASALSDLFEGLELTEDCYAVGSTAKFLASEVSKLSSAKTRNNVGERCTVIFVDRTLDLVQPSSQALGNLADKILEALPKTPGHNADVMVDMAPIFCSETEKAPSIILPGSLARNPPTTETQKILTSMITKKTQECLTEIYQKLLDVLKSESISILEDNIGGKVTADKLFSLVKYFRNNLDLFIKHSGLIQLTMAAVNTLQSEGNNHLQQLQGTEKVMQLSLNEEESPSCLSHILMLLQNVRDRTRSYCFEEILLLLLFVHSLVGNECSHSPDESKELEKVIIDDVLSKSLKVETNLVLDMSNDNERAIKSKITRCFERLSALKSLRNDLNTFKNLFTSSETGAHELRSYEPLLKQIIGKIYDPTQPEISDIEFMSTSLKDYIKSGFSLFMNVRKQHPSDNGTLFIFVVGGVTCTEVQNIKDLIISRNIKTKVLIGGTQILNSQDTVRCFFGQDNVFPDLDVR